MTAKMFLVESVFFRWLNGIVALLQRIVLLHQIVELRCSGHLFHPNDNLLHFVQ